MFKDMIWGFASGFRPCCVLYFHIRKFYHWAFRKPYKAVELKGLDYLLDPGYVQCFWHKFIGQFDQWHECEECGWRQIRIKKCIPCEMQRRKRIKL